MKTLAKRHFLNATAFLSLENEYIELIKVYLSCQINMVQAKFYMKFVIT